MKNADKPAYPPGNPLVIGQEGLTKREAFAMAAMQGILGNGVSFWADAPDELVAKSIKCADELLKQLEP